MKTQVLKGWMKSQEFAVRCKQKMLEKRGSGELASVMILILIAVVIGGVIMLLFGDTVKSMWQTLQTKIATLFSYT